MALRARRKKAAPRAGIRTFEPWLKSQRGYGTIKPKRSTWAAGTTPVGAPKPPSAPAAAPQQAVPSIKPTRPLQLPSSAASATDAAEQYGLGVTDVNRAIMQAAMNYGGAPTVGQYGIGSIDPVTGAYIEGADTKVDLADQDPNTPGIQAATPNSAVSVIGRNWDAAKTGITNRHSAGNTFFSGFQLADQGEALNERDRQLTQAETDYNNAIAEYMSNILGMRSQRDSTLRGGLASDLEYAMNQPPEPSMEPAAPAGPGAGGAPAAEPGYKSQFGHDSQGNAGTWHIYPPSLRYPKGRKVFVRRQGAPGPGGPSGNI